MLLSPYVGLIIIAVVSVLVGLVTGVIFHAVARWYRKTGTLLYIAQKEEKRSTTNTQIN